MGIQMAFAYVGVLLGPALMGVFAAEFGMQSFAPFMLGATIVLALSYLLYSLLYAKFKKNAQ